MTNVQAKVKKKPTEAWLKADAIRTEYFPKYEKIVAPDFSVCAFVGFNKDNKANAVIFKGRSLKPRHNYWYQSVDARERAVHKFFEEHKKSPKIDTNKIYAIGDVLYSSWGYEQTNIDFYQVIRLIGTTMIEIREIAKTKTNQDNYNDRGTCLPLVNAFVGEPLRKSVSVNGYITLSSFSCASALPKNDDGSYHAKDWSSYH
jgi:hypothetical protein